MKHTLILIILILRFGCQSYIFSQTTVQVSGTVKSAQGAIQGAEVSFLKLNDEFESNCISGTDGKFRSETKMQVGKSIKIKVKIKGYKPSEKTYSISRTGDAGEFMLKKEILAISGFVKDSISEMAIPDVEIFFYQDSKMIQTQSTNSMGYFDIETDFSYGQKITVKAAKKGYHDKEQTLTFTSEGRNTLQDILLPQIGDRGLRAFIQVKDKKNSKALGGAGVRYFDKKKSTFVDTLVSSKGVLELKLYQQPGTILDLRISKPNYLTIEDKKTLSEDPLLNEFKYELVRDRRTATGKTLLIVGGLSAIVSGGTFILSNSKYNSYKDFKNPDRESDFNAAQNMRTISAVAAGVAVGALAGYIIYKINQKNKEKALEQKAARTTF